MVIELCDLREIPAGQGLERRAAGADGDRDVILFRTGGGLRAFLNVCPHQGRPLSLSPGEFVLGKHGELICPHHGAAFELETGACLSGPCRGDCLTPIVIELRGGKVMLPDPGRAPVLTRKSG